MKRNQLILAAVIVSAVVYLGYQYLGGSKEITYTRETGVYTIVGEEFTGSYNSPKLESIFKRAKSNAETLKGRLAVVNYGSDTEAKQVTQFIGVAVETIPSDLGQFDYEVREFSPSYFISALISAHNLVMPKPNAVREGAATYSGLPTDKLDEKSIEIYSSDRQLHVLFMPK